MKKVIIPVLALLLLSWTPTKKGLSKSERNMAITEMNKSYKHLFKTVKGLSEAQLNFKSDESSWSIAECTEHIAIAETSIFSILERSLKTPADPSKRSGIELKDQDILDRLTNRTTKVKTRESSEPTGKFGSYKASLKEFKSKRKAHIKYIKKTDDDLRNHYGQLPFGKVDAYQVLLFLSAHTERHVLQIEEVMSHENFPKK